jgi:hypothetical protein
MSDNPPDLTEADDTIRAISEVSLRLMAGTVSKPKMAQLRVTVEQNDAEFPWQSVTQSVLSEEVESQRLVQQGLAAQRDWILRGGRTAKGPSVGYRAKGFVARLTAQLIFATIFTVVILITLLLLNYKMPELDIYRITTWLQGLFGS